MNESFQNHGAFSWMELQTPETDAAKSFYAKVIGWEQEEMAMPNGAYSAIKVKGQPIGGFKSQEGGFWMPYITVDDVEERTRIAQENGAKVLAGPMDLPGVGKGAAIEDPFGARAFLITYAPPA